MSAWSSFPALGLFRNGHFLAFVGDMKNTVEVQGWLTDTDALEVEGIVEQVTEDMLTNIIELEDDVLVCKKYWQALRQILL